MLARMDDELDWPPPDARLTSALWRAEGHLERGEYATAAHTLEHVLALGERELVRGLYHLAAAGYKARNGDRKRALRQLAHARRRLAPFLPVHSEVELAAALDLVEREIEQARARG
jgi:hypothetical protein